VGRETQHFSQYFFITLWARESWAGLPVGCQPCSTAFSRRFCRAAFAGVVCFAFTPCGVETRTAPVFPILDIFTGIYYNRLRCRVAAITKRTERKAERWSLQGIPIVTVHRGGEMSRFFTFWKVLAGDRSRISGPASGWIFYDGARDRI